jgi:hypothetical protein
MASFPILDVVIGLVFVYLSLSLLCSGINEWIARLLTSRSRHLEGWLSRFFSDPTLLTRFQEQPLIKELSNRPYRQRIAQNQLIKKVIGSGKIPAYIPSHTFVLTLLDLFAPVDPTTGKRSLDDIRGNITAPPNPNMQTAANAVGQDIVKLGQDIIGKQQDPRGEPTTAGTNTMPSQANSGEDVRRTLRALIGDAENISTAQQNIQTWFDDAMERVSGRYKRRTQLVVLILAVGISIGLNVDTFRIVRGLYRDPTVRAAVVAAAQRTAQQPSTTDVQSPLTMIDKVQSELQQLNLPIGRSDASLIPSNDESRWLVILGWFITGFAVSQGAPFWFDTLNKLVNVRSTGDPPPNTAQK